MEGKENKIFIVGNGFDLAHGAKTKFSDFAEYYLSKIIIPEIIACVNYVKKDSNIILESALKSWRVQRDFKSGNNPIVNLGFFASIKNAKLMKKIIRDDYTLLQHFLKNKF